MIKVSVITPSFNQGRFIERTLQSVASQIVPDVEIEHVVFDGASTDNTLEVLKKFSPSVRWISKEDNGQADAINQGIQATDGEIIGWLNSDDIYFPGAIAKVVAFFNANPQVDIIYGMADHIDEDDRAFEPYPTEPWSFEKLKENCFICQPALFFRRRVFERHGLLKESLNYCMDYEYWLRLGIIGVSFAYLESRLAGSRLYKDNKTLGSKVKVHREINDMLKSLFGTVPDRWLFNYAHAVVGSELNRECYPKRFVLLVSLRAIFYSIYWNRGISLAMLKEARGWILAK